ncbi:MAG TPA: sigma-70 family RNA polymerase sigma factor [Xanthobacteraceae bacterium]|jgi:RNA polymerase sigma-70 factor (ECF subfamily)
MACELLSRALASRAVACTAAARSSDLSVVDVRPRNISQDDVSDRSLVARVAAGDRQALQQLFVRHRSKVYRFVMRQLSDRMAAEDIVSEVFVALWRNADRFDGRAQFSTWLLAIARNKARDARRRRVEQPFEPAFAEAIPDPAPTPEDSWDAGKRQAVVRKCLARLSPAHREMLDLVYYHDKSIEEICTIIGVPAATVKTRMFYARTRLGEFLTTAGVATARS